MLHVYRSMCTVQFGLGCCCVSNSFPKFWRGLITIGQRQINDKWGFVWDFSLSIDLNNMVSIGAQLSHSECLSYCEYKDRHVCSLEIFDCCCILWRFCKRCFRRIYLNWNRINKTTRVKRWDALFRLAVSLSTRIKQCYSCKGLIKHKFKQHT